MEFKPKPKIGDKVQIIGSQELYQMRLDDTIGYEGIVTEVVYRSRNSGCWINIKTGPKVGEWWIPLESIYTL